MSKIVRIGNVAIGGGNPPVVQGMVKTRPSDKETVRQINEMAQAGCRMVRIAVPDSNEAEFLSKLKRKIKIPLIADIHFNWRFALAAIDAGADKIRINPSNIGAEWKVREIANAARGKIPIRVGSNSGSLKELKSGEKPASKARKLFNAVEKEVEALLKFGFDDIVVSAKAEDVETTIEVNRLLSKLPYPIHIGVTATGTVEEGIIKSSIALGTLLREGIGDTIRVSLADSPVEEIKVAYQILSESGLSKKKIAFIACPSCGRCNVNLKRIVKRVSQNFPDSHIPAKKTLSVAIMGCEVNGPGEAKNADIGIAFSTNSKKAVYFEKGQVKKIVDAAEAENFLTEKIRLKITGKTAD